MKCYIPTLKFSHHGRREQLAGGFIPFCPQVNQSHGAPGDQTDGREPGRHRAPAAAPQEQGR